MTQTIDPMAAYAALVGPGGPFEMVVEDVRGVQLPIYRNRRRALHELLAESVQHGDRTYIATADRSVTFAEHAANVSSLAKAPAAAHGLGKGHRVVIDAANTVGGLEPVWAIASPQK